MAPLSLGYHHPSQLKPHPSNARTHSRQQIKKIAASIERFGWSSPVIINSQNQIIAGHGRVQAALLLGMDSIPTIARVDLTNDDVRQLMLAENKIAMQAGWNDDILKIEFQHFISNDIEIETTGFEIAEVDVIIGDSTSSAASADDEIPPLTETATPVTRRGDLWILGKHKLLCGDATIAADYVQLLGDERAELVFSDPPYNVPIVGHVTSSQEHTEFAMASGEMSDAEFIQFLKTVMAQLVRNSIDGALHFLFMDWKHAYEILVAGRHNYPELKSVCVWNKTNAGMGSLYRSKHELVFVFKNGKKAHINNIRLGRLGRNRTNVWDYAGVNTFRPGRLEELKSHPTVKPVALIVDALKDCSRPNGIVLDVFGGSGSTLIGAEKAQRRARLIEIEPKYCDLIVRRWEKLTSSTAVHAGGSTFAQIEKERCL